MIEKMAGSEDEGGGRVHSKTATVWTSVNAVIVFAIPLHSSA